MAIQRPPQRKIASRGGRIRRDALDPVVILNQLNRRVHATQDVDEVCLLHLEAIVEKMGYEAAMVAILNRGRAALEGCIAMNCDETLARSLDVSIDDSESVMVEVAMGAEPVVIRRGATEGRVLSPLRDVLGEGRSCTGIVLPLLNGIEPPRCCQQQAQPEQWHSTFSPRCLSCYNYPVEGVLVVGSCSVDLDDADVEVLQPFAGRLGSALGSINVLSRLRESLESSHTERDWLVTALNNIPEPVLLTDLNNDIIVENRKAEELFSSSGEDSEGKKQACGMNNFLLSVVLSSYSVDENPAPRELTLVDPMEGEELPYEILSTHTRNPRTGQEGIVSLMRNVTDLKRATEELSQSFEQVQELRQEARQERQRLNLIIQNVADPVIVTNIESEVLLMNEQAERLFGRPAAGGVIAGTDERRRTYEANEVKFTSFVSQMRIEVGPRKSGELELVDPDTGEQMSVSVVSGEIEDELGQPTAVISILHDLTKVRELERTQLEKQLFESEKLAATGRLAASIAHEINNPLEAIKNSLYLLSSKFQGEDEDRRFLEIANRETERVSAIIQQMLGFYRPSLALALVSVNSIIEDILGLMEKQLQKHRVIVKKELAPDLPPVLGHGDQLKQVFLNMVLNNQDAMPRGGTLTVCTHIAKEEVGGVPYKTVNVEFSDTGSGIAPEILPHIFEPFFTTKAEKGTGLGLWVSFGIIQSHNGHISVKSRPDRGVTFTISLPVIQQA
ncbi:MAG TPA: ATP-binding protein [Chloroflexota bacterium]|jgi:PAS domain S-box-containing protein|nr:ATP-binding protein [Chloroflexota bacterium]